MNVDYKKTLDLVKGALLNPADTWNPYLGENPGWQLTLIVLTAPLILANVVLGLLLSRIMGTMSFMNMGGNWFVALVLGLVMTCVAFAVDFGPDIHAQLHQFPGTLDLLGLDNLTNPHLNPGKILNA